MRSGIARALVTDVAEAAARGRRPPAGVLAEERRLPPLGRSNVRQHAQQRRLSGAVRAEQHDQLAGLDRQVEPRQDRRAAEVAPQALGDDRRPDQPATTWPMTIAPPRPR